MRATLLALALSLSAGAAERAQAGVAPCWYEHGAIVVSAEAGEIADDYILDLAAPQSQLHETRARAAGFEADAATLPLRLAGLQLGDRSFAVEALDDRTGDFPTNIAGVIGADALKGYVVDVSFKPCRVKLWRGRAPRLPTQARLPLVWVGGVPTIAAAVADSRSAKAGRFAIDTGGAGVRIAKSEADLSRPLPAGLDAASRERPPGRLRALSLGDALFQNLGAGIDPGLPDGVLGAIGNDVWQHYELRVDLKRNRLSLAPAKRSASARRPARSGGSLRRGGR